MNVYIDKDRDYNDVEIRTKSSPNEKFKISRDYQDFDAISQKSNSAHESANADTGKGKLSLEAAGVDLLISNGTQHREASKQTDSPRSDHGVKDRSWEEIHDRHNDSEPKITLEIPQEEGIRIEHPYQERRHDYHDHDSPRSHYQNSPRHDRGEPGHHETGYERSRSGYYDHDTHDDRNDDRHSRTHHQFRDEYDTRSRASDTSHVKTRESPEEIDRQKRELLILFEKLEKKKVYIPKKFTMDSPLEEMKFEYEKLKSMYDAETAVKLYRDVLKAFVSGAEYVNNNYNPYKLRLEGWSEGIYTNIEDYDDVFEELHLKYAKRVNIPPEIKLLGMVLGSGLVTHITNRVFKNAPVDFGDIMKENPDLRKQFQAASLAKSSNQSSVMTDIFGMVNKLGGNIPQRRSAPSPSSSPTRSAPVQKKEMRRPTNFDDILNTCQNQSTKLSGRAQPQEDEIKSVNLSEMNEIERLSEVSSMADSHTARDPLARPNAGMRPTHREAFISRLRSRKKGSGINKAKQKPEGGLILDI